MEELPQHIRQIIEDSIGSKIIRLTIPDCGLSAALRASVKLENGDSVFVKAATDEQTENWLRTEYIALSSLKEPFAPCIIDWIDEPGLHPILLTQDLSHAYWPASHSGVHWREKDFDLLFEGIYKLSSLETIAGLPKLVNNPSGIWTKIASFPERFLNLKLCSAKWLNNAVDHLIEAEKKQNETGSHLVHGDIRSDNICFLNNQVVFVDWSCAASGNKNHDLATLLPTLYLEGGPHPYTIMPDGSSYASALCAGHIKRLGERGAMPNWLVGVFKKLIAIELEWAAKCLGLEKPDGISWNAID